MHTCIRHAPLCRCYYRIRFNTVANVDLCQWHNRVDSCTVQIVFVMRHNNQLIYNISNSQRLLCELKLVVPWTVSVRPLNLSILISGGDFTTMNAISNCEWMWIISHTIIDVCTELLYTYAGSVAWMCKRFAIPNRWGWKTRMRH